jgi:hypothetical protein
LVTATTSSTWPASTGWQARSRRARDEEASQDSGGDLAAPGPARRAAGLPALGRIVGRRLRIRPIEAIDGTPVVDIKPVLDGRPDF